MPGSQSYGFRVLHYARRRMGYFLQYYLRNGGEPLNARVCLNSIPKSGTHLIEKTVLQIPGLRNTGKRTIRGNRDRIHRGLAGVPRGGIVTSHIPYNAEFEALIAEHGLVFFEMIRDPRDIVVSRAKYLGGIDTTHRHYSRFKGLADDESRLRLAIEGIPGEVLSIAEMLQGHAPWLSSPHVSVVRFESLIGPAGGGNREEQIRAVQAITYHLGVELSRDEIEMIAARTFDESSLTFRSPTIGGWKGSFSEQNRSLFKACVGELLLRYGYESSLDW